MYVYIYIVTTITYILYVKFNMYTCRPTRTNTNYTDLHRPPPYELVTPGVCKGPLGVPTMAAYLPNVCDVNIHSV